MSNTNKGSEKKVFEFYNLPWYFFLILAAIVLVAAGMQVLPLF